MSLLNAIHVALDRAGGGIYTNLIDYIKRRRVYTMPFSETDITANGQYNLLDSSGFSGTIALGTASTTDNGGWQAAALAGAVGTAANTSISDSLGHVTNLVDIRYADSHDPVLDSNGRRVYGLLQAASTVTDGDAVGPNGSENIQVSYIIVDADGTITLTTVAATIELALPKLYASNQVPEYAKAGVSPETDIASAASLLVRKYVALTDYAADEVITVSTGTGSGTGTSTPSGDTISSIGADAATFNGTATTRIRLNGLQLTKGTDVIWDSATTFHFSVPISADDRWEIELTA